MKNEVLRMAAYTFAGFVAGSLLAISLSLIEISNSLEIIAAAAEVVK